MHYWGVKLEDIRRACSKHGITHMRRPVGAGGRAEGHASQRPGRLVGCVVWMSRSTRAQALALQQLHSGGCMGYYVSVSSLFCRMGSVTEKGVRYTPA